MRELGCEFALDDFGAGFASFYYLKHLAFDYLKIDGEFIKDLPASATNQLLVQRRWSTSRTGLGKYTIAEFVQDAAHARAAAEPSASTTPRASTSRGRCPSKRGCRPPRTELRLNEKTGPDWPGRLLEWRTPVAPTSLLHEHGGDPPACSSPLRCDLRGKRRVLVG